MATSNFKTQNNFPLFASAIFDAYEYEDEETGETLCSDFDYVLCDYCENKIEDFNRTLEFYKIELRSGYYSGVQIILDEQEGAELSEYYTPEQWKYERAAEKIYHGENYDFRYCYSEQKRREVAEIKKIERFCRGYLKDEFGFEEYYISARFSNGETWYTKRYTKKNGKEEAAV